MKNRFCSLFKNRKGAQTLEYILILTAVVILGMVLYNFMSGGELRQTLQTKMEQIFAGIVGDGAETATKEKEPKPDPKPDPPPNPKKEEKKEEEESFLDNSYVQEGTDFVLDSIPIVGNIKSLYEVASGKDIFGNELSDFDRAASGAGVLIPGAKHVKRGVKVADKGIDLVNGVKKTDKAKKKPKKKGCTCETDDGNGGKSTSKYSHLTDRQKQTVEKIDRTISNHLTEKDFSGTRRDLEGNPVPRKYGGYYDHLQEMEDALNSLQNSKRKLKGALKNPNLDPMQRKTMEESLEKSQKYIDRIYDLFNEYNHKPRRQ